MARTNQKRKRSDGPFRSAKRRRFSKRGRVRRRRRTTSYSSRQLNASNGFAFKNKVIRGRRWRNILWKDTLMETHYRSIGSVHFTNLIATPTGISSINMAATSMMDQTPASAFWKVAGGLQDPNYGGPPGFGLAPSATTPEPIGIVVRGGRLWVTVANPSATDTINVRVQLAYPKQQLRNQDDNADSNVVGTYLSAVVSGNPRPISWSIQAAPDYSSFFYPPFLDKTMDLKPGDDLMLMHRIRIKKVDIGQFIRGGGNFFPMIFIYAGQRVDTTAGAQAVNVTLGHNISFVVTDLTQ